MCERFRYAGKGRCRLPHFRVLREQAPKDLRFLAVKRAEGVERKPVAAGRATEVQVLVGPADGAPNFALRRFIMGAGGGMPRHTNTVEHEQYILNGKARIGIAEDVFEVKKGDVVFIPENIPHWYQNIGDETFEFLCVVPNKVDKTTILSDELPC